MPTPFSLPLEQDSASGQLLRIGAEGQEMPIFQAEPGTELFLNDVPLETTLVSSSSARGEHLTEMTADVRVGYGAGARLEIRRMISRGGYGLRPGVHNSVHIRYEITRVPVIEAADGYDYIWKRPVESPIHLDSVTVLGAPQTFFGPTTRMKTFAIGGTGPREHVSLEDGPIADVLPWLKTGFRTEFPGQLSANGALYYHPDTEEWVWILVRRPTTTGRILFDENQHAYRFGYHKDLPIQDEIWTPAVSYFWGQGLDAADKLLADQFDVYEEMPDWGWNTVWFWLHSPWTKDVNYAKAAEAVKILSGECGVNGYGIFAHDLPLSGNDCDLHSPAPSPTMGGEPGMKQLTQTIRAHQAHSYAWISRHGFRPDSMDFNPQWGVKGIDDRHIRLRNPPDTGVNLDMLNPSDPDFKRYLQGWITRYVKDYGIDGLFWDSGYQPSPPDFGKKPYLRWPGQANALSQKFYADILRFGKDLHPDFFMWAEGISLDMPMNLFSVDAKKHGENSGNRYMQKLAHLGSKRIMWRSHWKHDLASGFVMLNPMNDIGMSFKDYKTIANDPVNQWVCKTVRERGVKYATGLGDGISRLDEFVMVSPEAGGSVLIPDAPSETLGHVLSGTSVTGTREEGGIRFDLTETGPYSF